MMLYSLLLSLIYEHKHIDERYLVCIIKTHFDQPANDIKNKADLQTRSLSYHTVHLIV